VTVPLALQAGKIIAVARALNPKLRVIASAYSVHEEAHLLRRGADEVIVGGREIARVMAGRGDVD
jgi:CPA2 family monovalent cation:H+ antiporter-2